MTVRLSGAVVPGPDRQVWATGPAGSPVDASDLVPAPGTPVALGPRSADTRSAGRAVAELARLTAAAGAIVAGAGVDLGDGFRSARIDGGAGDRRDAVLAALRVPGLGDRLGEPRALLVALFGAEATKRLGGATLTAIGEGRWAALRYTVAASDVLGPEQLEQVLALGAPDGVDPFPDGLASVVGRHLARVLADVPRPRRLGLLTDLWEQVCADGAARLRRERLRASQGRQHRIDDLLVRYRHYEDDELMQQLEAELGRAPTVVRAALWQPSAAYWSTRATRVLRDAFAATVLARVAVTAVDRGTEAAVADHRHEIEAAVAELSTRDVRLSARRVPGLTGLPVRPGSYLRDILARVRPGEPLDPRSTAYVNQRLAAARDYGQLALFAARELFWQVDDPDWPLMREHLADWAADGLPVWRDRVGYLSPGRLAAWQHRPLLAPHDEVATLAERLRADPRRPLAEVETIGDCFWYAELADAVAHLFGHPAAQVTSDRNGPSADVDPAEPDEPLVPRRSVIPLAVAGTAQLVDLGGQVPRRCRTWSELVAALLTDTTTAEALTGAFPVPAPALAVDGTVVPGTDARVEVARTRRQLADWAAFMGNCIAGPRYTDLAASGRVVLVALRAPDGRILANAELQPSARGWGLWEIQGRFNQSADPDLRRHTEAWVAGLATPAPPVPPTEPTPDLPARRAARPAPAARAVRDLGRQLDEMAAVAIAEPDTVRAVEAMAALRASAGEAVPADPRDALTALRRSRPADLVWACRSALAGGGDPGGLWRATGDRPLVRAVAALPPSTVDRLGPLLVDAPLPGSLRALARLPDVAVARTAHLVALRVRAALGVLLREDAPELARVMHVRPYAPLVRAAALAVTSWGGLAPAAGAAVAVSPPRRVRLPGFPPSSLRDEAWQAAWPDAIDLGGVADDFWPRIAAHGLLLPSSWLAGGDWAGLWARATARR